MNSLVRTPSSAARAPVACALGLLIGSCGDVAPHSTGSGTTASFVVAVPRTALGQKIIDPDALDVVITLDGRETNVTAGVNGQRRAAIELPEGETVPIEITWLDRAVTPAVPLFAMSTEIGPVLREGTQIRIDKPYTELDSDGDGESNLEARDASRDPFAGNRVTAFSALEPRSVNIPRMAPGSPAPVIDGIYDESGVWTDDARFRDVGGDRLHVDNLLVGDGAGLADGEPEYRWFAMHDGEALYLAVVFEGARDDEAMGSPREDAEYTPYRDSERLSDDDGLNLFVDGDDSRRPTLDGVDDVYLQFPQITATDGTGEGVLASRPYALDPYAALPGLEYASCVCRRGVSSWEMKIPLSMLGVQVGRPFGIEVQIDQDRDGGERDVRWGWANPSFSAAPDTFRTGSPTFNGLAVLTDATKAAD